MAKSNLTSVPLSAEDEEAFARYAAAVAAEDAAAVAAEDAADGAARTLAPFSWLSPEAQRLPGAKLACLTQDYAQGLGVVLELIDDARWREMHGEAPSVSVQQRGNLWRLVVAAVKTLDNEAADTCDRFNEIAEQQQQQHAQPA